jgi:hypothetical protein
VSLITNSALRLSPFNFALLTGLSLNLLLNNSSSIFFISVNKISLLFFVGKNSDFSVTIENFSFHGQTSWQISQPKIQLSNLPENSGEISPLFSIVK